MSRIIFFKITIILLFASSGLKSQSWVQSVDFPGTERDDGVAFVIDNKAYCLSGLEVGWQCTGNGYVLDGSTETWSIMASIPSGTERQYATGFSYNNFGYLLGGINCSGNCLNDFFQYSPTLNAWTQLPNFPSIGRQGMSNFIIKDKLYVLGGKLTDGTILNEVWEYNFSNSNWTQKNNLPFNGMWRGSAFAIDTIGYVCYGVNNDAYYNRFMFKYNYVNDTWTKISNVMLPDRKYVGTAVCSQMACLYGGVDSLGTIANTVYVFNPTDSSVTVKAAIPSFARKGGMAFSLSNAFYYTTGVTDAFRTKETWKTSELVGLNELENISNLKIYPNPSNGIFFIDNLIVKKIKIYNSFGQQVDFISSVKDNSIMINVKNIETGVYMLEADKNNNLYRRKIIIE